MINVYTRQGKGGRWRWLAYTPTGVPGKETFRAVCDPRGFEDEQRAGEDAADVFAHDWIRFHNPDGSISVAGPRDVETE